MKARTSQPKLIKRGFGRVQASYGYAEGFVHKYFSSEPDVELKERAATS